MDAPLLTHNLAACESLVAEIERAEAAYREGHPVEAALALNTTIDRIRAHLRGEDI